VEPQTVVALGGITVSYLTRKQVHLDPAVVEDLERIVRTKGGRRKGYSFSHEVNVALREYVRRCAAEKDEQTLTPVWERLLNEKFGQLEAWLRPGVWGGATYSTTASLMLLELMCGKTIDPKEAKDHFELIRGRAWKMVRKDPAAARTATAEDER